LAVIGRGPRGFFHVNIVALTSEGSQLLCRLESSRDSCVFTARDADRVGFQNIDRQLGTAELYAGGPLDAAVIEEALRLGFEQLALGEIYVRNGEAAGRIYEDAGFRRHDGCPGGLSLHASEWRARRGLGPRVVLMQPHFLPWLGYLELIDRADVFVFLDDFQFSRQSWSQRNRLFAGPGSVGMVTLPIRHEHNPEATFLDIREANPAWRRKLRNLLTCNYQRARYGAAVLALVDEWLAEPYANVGDLEIALIEKISAYLGLGARFVRSSTLGIDRLRRSARLVAILKTLGAGTYVSAHGSFPYMKEDGVFPLANLPVYFQDHAPREYAQHGSGEFVPRLSCLDALANLAPSEVRVTLRGTEWWQSWEERAASEIAA